MGVLVIGPAKFWKIVGPLVVFCGLVGHIRIFGSYVKGSEGPWFHYGWIYLIPILFVALLLIFYFYTYKGGRLYRYLGENDSKVKFWLKGLGSLPFVIVIFSYGLFHVLVWAASFVPAFPVATKHVLVTEMRYGWRARRNVIVTGQDRHDTPVYMRFKRRLAWFEEGDTISVRCRDVTFVCRVIDLETIENDWRLFAAPESVQTTTTRWKGTTTVEMVYKSAIRLPEKVGYEELAALFGGRVGQEPGSIVYHDNYVTVDVDGGNLIVRCLDDQCKEVGDYVASRLKAY